VREKRNPTLEVLGVVLTCVDSRTKLAAEVEQLVARELPGRAFQTFITQATAVAMISGKGKTLFQVLPHATHKVADQYRCLAAEVEHRVKNRAAFLAGDLEPLSFAAGLPVDEPDGAEDDSAVEYAAVNG
jgi:cellulose biosynthesis protein BcsQ